MSFLRSLAPLVCVGIAGILGGCPPVGVGYYPNVLFRGLTLERSAVEVGDEVGAVVSTVPLANFSSRAHGRVVVNFGDGTSAADQQANLSTGIVSGGKYRVQATGDGGVPTRIAYRYARAGTFTVTATVYKDLYGSGEHVDGSGTASIMVLATSQPGSATPIPPAPTPTAAPASATPQPVTPTPETPAPQTPQPATPAPNTPQPETPPAPQTPQPQTPAPVTPPPATPVPATPQPPIPAPSTPAPVTPPPATPVPPPPTPVPPPPTPVPPTPTPQPTFSDPPDPTPRPSETPGDFEDDPDPTPRP